MQTTHQIYFKNSSEMEELDSNSIDLMITSPPYPMIEMWDSHFSKANEEIEDTLVEGNGKRAYKLMHIELNKVWKEVTRVLKFGGMACINIGDATRKINNSFQLFPNHIDIANFFHDNDFIELPSILWCKPTNSPNKFLGSGMLPPNAYVTLEHEYILIFRKGKKRRIIPPKSENRYNSAFFWEERNKWFSDVWDDVRGINQKMNQNNEDQVYFRNRSAAFPVEIPYRLINMYSIYEDYILDPFWGTGTTSLAAMILGRNSIGYELNSEFMTMFKTIIKNVKKMNREINESRIGNHIKFIHNFIEEGKELKYKSSHYKFPVMTNQEVNILLYLIEHYKENQNNFKVDYEKFIFND